jgi:hypothetical protein
MEKVMYGNSMGHLIDENRLFSMFSHSGGRDFNFKNNKWK